MRWLLAFTLIAGTAAANVPDSSKRPVLRPESLSKPPVLQSSGAIATAEARAATVRGTAPGVSLRPQQRTRAVRRLIRSYQKQRAEGAVCNDPDLQGEFVGAVPGRIAGCGVAEAVRLRAVSDVLLSQQAVMDCPTAQALKSWIENSVQPTLANKGGGLKGLRVAGHYVCRTRNHKRGARISEHGKGRAIDISAFVLQDGTTITVLKGWTSRDHGQALRDMHKGACGPFGTVLGPNADSFHRDHFHFDTARYRSGTYCR